MEEVTRALRSRGGPPTTGVPKSVGSSGDGNLDPGRDSQTP